MIQEWMLVLPESSFRGKGLEDVDRSTQKKYWLIPS